MDQIGFKRIDYYGLISTNWTHASHCAYDDYLSIGSHILNISQQSQASKPIMPLNLAFSLKGNQKTHN